MGRREDESTVSREVSISGIGDKISAGGMNLAILDAWVESGGKRVTEVEVGKEFVVKVKYSASYPELGFWFDVWVVSITASDGKTVNLWDNTTLYVKEASGTMTLDNPKPAVMPAENVRLVIQPWGSDKASDYYTPPPQPWV